MVGSVKTAVPPKLILGKNLAKTITTTQTHESLLTILIRLMMKKETSNMLDYKINQKSEEVVAEGLKLYQQSLFDPSKESLAVTKIYEFLNNLGFFRPENYIMRHNHLQQAGVISKDYCIGEVVNLPSQDLIKRGYGATSYFGLLRYLKSYCLKDKLGVIMEAPHEIIWRVCCNLLQDPKERLQAFELMWVEKAYTLATPMLMQSGTTQRNNASCFLVLCNEDSLSGIYETVSDIAQISKSGGGIGVSLTNVRGKGSPIKGTNGVSNGIVPVMGVLQATSRYVDQGGGKRKGSVSVYLEPWHPDIMEFLMCTRESAPQEHYFPDLFTALYVNDVFMEKVEHGGHWHLFCPSVYPELLDLHGEAFRKRYGELVSEGAYVAILNARDVMEAILHSQVESGRPYVVNKDAVNDSTLEAKAFGTIKSSNLCAEITEYTDENTIAVCTLGSVSMVKWYSLAPTRRTLLAYLITKMLNNSINADHAVSKTHKHTQSRPIGVGWQGVADIHTLLGNVWGSEEALVLEATLQEDLQNRLIKASELISYQQGVITSAYDKAGELMVIPRANSMLTANMPTKSTSHLLGWSEGIDPHRSLVYRQNVGTISVTRMPPSIVKYLQSIGKFHEGVINNLVSNNGSAQGLDTVFTPEEQAVLRCAFEVGNKAIISHAKARQPFVCQSQSMNLYYAEPSTSLMYSALMYAWKSRLKTLSYYSEVANKSFGTNVVTSTFVEKPLTPHETVACGVSSPDCESCGG
jgi:ribonucleoside-diphosphate reductase alpha chain